MGSLEKKQAGAVSVSVLGVILLIAAVVLTLTDQCGGCTLLIGLLGSGMMLAGVATNAHVAREMMQDGRC